MMPTTPHLRSIRIWLSIFIVGLVLSGISAFPLVSETGLLVRVLHAHPFLPQAIIVWVDRVHQALYDDSVAPHSLPMARTGSPLPTSSSRSPSSVRSSTRSVTNGY